MEAIGFGYRFVTGVHKVAAQCFRMKGWILSQPTALVGSMLKRALYTSVGVMSIWLSWGLGDIRLEAEHKY